MLLCDAHPAATAASPSGQPTTGQKTRAMIAVADDAGTPFEGSPDDSGL